MIIIGWHSIKEYLNVSTPVFRHLIERPDFPVTKLKIGSRPILVTSDLLLDSWAVAVYSEKVKNNGQEEVDSMGGIRLVHKQRGPARVRRRKRKEISSETGTSADECQRQTKEIRRRAFH